MPAIPTNSQILIDLTHYAFSLENKAAAALRPYPIGFYASDSLEPVIKPGCVYYQRESKDSRNMVAVRIEKLEDIQSDIFNEDGYMLVNSKYKTELTREPQLPIHGIQMCMEYIEVVVDEFAAWAPKNPVKLTEFWEEFLLPGYAGNEEFLIPLHDSLTALGNILRSFLGDDRWIMHFTQAQGRSALVEKSIDYRIYDWTSRIASKEWV